MTGAPPQIQNRMNQRAGAAAKLAESIRANMDLVHERMENDLLDYRHSGVTADDVSKAMVPYIDQIAKLSRLQDPGALRLAQEVLLELASNTTPVEDASGYGERPSDAKCDDLLYSILERRADAIDMEHDVVKKTKEEIEDTAKSLAGYGIEPWFPKSLELLKEFEYSY